MAALEGRGRDWYSTSLIVADLADVLQVSRQTIYKISKDVRPSRKKRRDILASPRGLTGKQFDQLCGLALLHDLPAWKAISIAERLNLIPVGAITPENLNSWLRRTGLSRWQK